MHAQPCGGGGGGGLRIGTLGKKIVQNFKAPQDVQYSYTTILLILHILAEKEMF